MWTKQLISQMFPTNILPSTFESADVLLQSDPDTIVGTTQYKMARNMVIQQTQISWNAKGEKDVEVLYDVYPFPVVNKTPALNVYGGKMVQNWLQFNQDKFRSTQGKELIDAGFNYTGL